MTRSAFAFAFAAACVFAALSSAPVSAQALAPSSADVPAVAGDAPAAAVGEARGDIVAQTPPDAAGDTVAQTQPEPARVIDDSTLEDHRTALQALNEHFLGTASRPVRFDWRKANVMFVGRLTEVIERNTFGQWQVGVMARKAFGDILVDGGVNAFFATDTDSSRQLALTPFRQAGRPNHFQLEANVGYAVAEGVVTPVLGFLPPAELALVAWGGARYLVYPASFTGTGSFTDVAASLVSPQLSEGEIIRLENSGPAGMQIDRARVHALVGASLDVYLQPGVIIAPRAMVALPLLAPVTGTALGFFWELGISVGYAL